MTTAEVIQLIGTGLGGLIAGAGGLAGVSAYKSRRARREIESPPDTRYQAEISTALAQLVDATRDSARMLGEIRDILIETRGETRAIRQDGAHTQRAVERLHERMDVAIGSR